MFIQLSARAQVVHAANIFSPTLTFYHVHGCCFYPRIFTCTHKSHSHDSHETWIGVQLYVIELFVLRKQVLGDFDAKPPPLTFRRQANIIRSPVGMENTYPGCPGAMCNALQCRDPSTHKPVLNSSFLLAFAWHLLDHSIVSIHSFLRASCVVVSPVHVLESSAEPAPGHVRHERPWNDSFPSTAKGDAYLKNFQKKAHMLRTEVCVCIYALCGCYLRSRQATPATVQYQV